MAIFHDSAIVGASGNQGGGGYQIERSLRFNSSDSAYLSRTPASAGNRKTWTWAGWVKRSALNTNGVLFSAGPRSSSGNPTGLVYLQFEGDTLIFILWTGANTNVQLKSTPVYRDPSAWYHIVAVLDTDNATSTDRSRLYVNGTRITAFSSASYPSLGATFSVNDTTFHEIGRYAWGQNLYFPGYLADVHLVDGQALDPTSFTETDATTGQLIPKAYTGSYGTNGFHLPFSDNSTAAALGTDTSGNSNTWTVNNLSVTAGAGNDSLVDTPTSGSQVDTGLGGQVTGNYATLNPLSKGTNMVLSDGNLRSYNSVTAHSVCMSTIGVSTGKWYWEIFVTTKNNDSVGLANASTALNGADLGPVGIYNSNYSQGSVLGFALDCDSGKLFFAENNTWKNSGNPVTGANPWASSLTAGPYFPAASHYNFNGVSQYEWNFGQRPFAYTAPSGFKALCDTNLPAPVVAQPSTVMDVKLYTGNGGSKAVSGLSFSPDLVWIKGRSVGYGHRVFDTVRGTGTLLYTNATDAAVAQPNANDNFTSFDSGGFTLGAGIGLNENNATYVAWTWDAGSSTVTNTQGSITSQVRANASAGFSIVTYTGNGGSNVSVGHGLGIAPVLLIVKSRSTANDWDVTYTFGDGSYDFMSLNTTAAKLDITGRSAPTSALFYVNGGLSNVNGTTYVAYAWTPVAGYSSFGSYTGNGSADGPFVYTGFRPRWVMIKDASSGVGGRDWFIVDIARNISNVTNSLLRANLSNAESSYDLLDIVSNGFKLRGNDPAVNNSGSTYIYAAFAESPFQYARAR